MMLQLVDRDNTHHAGVPERRPLRDTEALAANGLYLSSIGRRGVGRCPVVRGVDGIGEFAAAAHPIAAAADIDEVAIT